MSSGSHAEGRALPMGAPRGARAMEYAASASFVRFDLPESADLDESAKTLASSFRESDALIRGFVVKGPRFVGVVVIWATRDAAEAFVDAQASDALGRRVGSKTTSHVLFEAPLLLDVRAYLFLCRGGAALYALAVLAHGGVHAERGRDNGRTRRPQRGGSGSR